MEDFTVSETDRETVEWFSNPSNLAYYRPERYVV